MNTDSFEYEILERGVLTSKDVKGFTCEIGVREGGGTKIIMDAVKRSGNKKIHIAIDPFGNIDYAHWESAVQKLNYTNKMKNIMLKNLYSYCEENDMECLFFPLEDTEFFEKYKNGVPVYNENKYVINEYSFIFLDGPHTTELVKKEFDFFNPRMRLGAVIVFDDINQYPHMEKLDSYIISSGYEQLEKGKYKISYIKIDTHIV